MNKDLEIKIRKFLCNAVIVVSLVLFSFLYVVNIDILQESEKLFCIFVVLGIFITLILVVFFRKGEIFNSKGTLEKQRILIMTTVMFIVVQVIFGFANYTNQALTLSHHSLLNSKQAYNNMVSKFDDVSQASVEEMEECLTEIKGDGKLYDVVYMVDENDIIIASADGCYGKGESIELNPLQYYIYPIKNYHLIIKDNESSLHEKNVAMISGIITVMAASIFLNIELMIFALKLLSDRILSPPTEIIDGKKSCMALRYVRQLAFLFYMAFNLPRVYISVMANELGGELFGITGSVLAGIPQSAETLFTCMAIFITAWIIERQGWKVSFVTGLLFVAVGNICTAVADNILLFIISRGVVGMGYGFCWMTLRNFALFGRNEMEKSEGFSLLNSGLYAGVNCGAVLGAVLAEKIGYSPVLFLSAVFIIFCSASVIKMENLVYKKEKVAEKKTEGPDKSSGYWQYVLLAMFVIFMIAPTCISGAFLNYYLPLYFIDIGHSISDVARARLMYGVAIIYIGPWIAMKIADYPNYPVWNLAYNGILSVAFVVFGFLGMFWPAIIAVLLLSIGDSFGFVCQNNYFLKMKAVKSLGESFSLSVLSFLKKMTEMMGPIVFGLLYAGIDTLNICVLGVAFFIMAITYFVFGRKEGIG